MTDDYKKIIKGIRPAWDSLKSHRYQNTKGGDNSSIASFKQSEYQNLKLIRNDLKKGSYKFGLLKASYKNKKNSIKQRRLLVGPIFDRIVSKAILEVIGYKFSKYFPSEINYCPVLKSSPRKTGKREQKNIQKAITTIKQAYSEGYIYAFETDIENFFDRINKERTKSLIKPHTDSRTYELITQIIAFKAVGLKVEDILYTEYGIAQGSSLSPLLANVYLHEFDKKISLIEDTIVIRYVDDLVILCKTKQKAKEVQESTIRQLKEIDLEINFEKTHIKNPTVNPLEFLGVQFVGSQVVLPSSKRKEILKELKKILLDDKYPNFLYKLSKIRVSLKSYIKYYKSLDKNDFNQQLLSIVDALEKEVHKYVEKKQKEIFKKDLFIDIKQPSKEEYYRFLGLNLDEFRVDVYHGVSR